MGNKVVEYLKEYRKERGSIPVSPIWGGEKAFPFMCLDHRTLAEMLGFEVIQATPVLATVREGQLSTGEQIDQFLSLGRCTGVSSCMWQHYTSYQKPAVIRSLCPQHRYRNGYRDMHQSSS